MDGCVYSMESDNDTYYRRQRVFSSLVTTWRKGDHSLYRPTQRKNNVHVLLPLYKRAFR